MSVSSALQGPVKYKGQQVVRGFHVTVGCEGEPNHLNLRALFAQLSNASDGDAWPNILQQSVCVS